MPKLSADAMSARRELILAAARRCVARKGFHATTIADLCRESGLSAGGIYTHFPDKHAIIEAIGRDATASSDEAPDWLARFDHLQSDAGEADARLDLHLWAGALTDPELRALVIEAFDGARAALAERSGVSVNSGQAALLEAVVLGLEVQRALGRPAPADLRARLLHLLHPEASP